MAVDRAMTPVRDAHSASDRPRSSDDGLHSGTKLARSLLYEPGRYPGIPEESGMSQTPKAVSRRDFIKGVIVGGVAVSSTGYLLRGAVAFGQTGLAGRLITLNVNGQHRRVDVLRQETLAWTLRYRLRPTSTKLASEHSD